MQNKKIILLLLSSVPFLMVLGNSMLIPEFNTIKTVLGITQFQVGLLITFFSASAAISIPFVGYLSDRWGRKAIIVPGVLLYGLGGIFSGLASALIHNPFNYILLGRVIQGVGAAGTAPIAIALAADIFPPEERSESMGILEAANGIGKVLSPIIGSAVALLAWYAIFFSYAFLSIPVALMIWFWIKEPTNEQGANIDPHYLRSLNMIFKQNTAFLLLNFLGGLLVLFVLFGVLSFTSNLIVTNFNLMGVNKGAILSIPLLTLAAAAYVTGLYLTNKNLFLRHAFLLGFIIIGISMFIFPFCCSSILFYPLILGMLGIGSGLVLPAINSMITGAIYSDQRGGITALYGSARFTGIALGPPVFSILQGAGIPFMFFVTGSISILVGILGFYYMKEQNNLD